MFHVMPLHILVEATEGNHAVRVSELLLPELLEVVPAGVVAAAEFDVERRMRSFGTAEVPHRHHDFLAALYDHYRRIPAREDAVVAVEQVLALEIAQIELRLRNFVGGDALAVESILRRLCLQFAFSLHESVFLCEQLLLECHLTFRAVGVDGRLDFGFLRRRRVVELGLQRLRNARLRFRSPKEQVGELLETDRRPEHAGEGHVVAADLGAVAHGELPPSCCNRSARCASSSPAFVSAPATRAGALQLANSVAIKQRRHTRALRLRRCPRRCRACRTGSELCGIDADPNRQVGTGMILYIHTAMNDHASARTRLAR